MRSGILYAPHLRSGISLSNHIWDIAPHSPSVLSLPIWISFHINPRMLEESARANPDARIRPLTHVSVNRAYQAESIGRNSLLSILIAIRRSPNL